MTKATGNGQRETGRIRWHAVPCALFLFAICFPLLDVSGALGQPRSPSSHANAAVKRIEALLRRGHQAERTGHYSGVKVIRASCSDRQSLDYERMVRIWHGGRRRTRLEFLPTVARGQGGRGIPRLIVIENGTQHWLYTPKQQAWRPISWSAPRSHIDLLLKNYRLSPESLETVAARRAQRLLIQPRSLGNPSKRTWLDLETGVPLRSDLFNCSGRRVSTMEYLEFRPERSLPSHLFQVPDGGSNGTPIQRRQTTDPRQQTGLASDRLESDRNADRLSFEPALPRYLPRGYVLDRVTRSRCEGKEVARARFTDGLNVLTLVQWRGSSESEPDGGSHERFWDPGEQIHWSWSERAGGGGAKRGAGPRGGAGEPGPGPQAPGTRPERGTSAGKGGLRRGGGSTRAEVRATLSGDLEVHELRRIADSVPSPRHVPERGLVAKRH